MKRVYFDTARDVLVIDGVRSVFPAKSLSVEADGDNVSIWLPDGVTRILYDRYDQLAGQDGIVFTSTAACVAAFNTTFQTPAAISGSIDGGNF